MTTITRREFLRLGGATAGSIVLRPWRRQWARPLPPREQVARKASQRGRIAEWSVQVHKEPDHSAPILRHHRRDDLVSYFEAVEAQGINPRNPIWFRVTDGYIYSSFVQPVEVHLNQPLQHLPPEGLWGEISVPYTDARLQPSPDAYRSYRFYYSSTYRLTESVWGADHRPWYRLHDNQAPGARRYVPAEHVRPLFPNDLAPISPHVRDKRIEISLADQLLTAIEGDEPVFATHISGGTGGNRSTPRGNHRIIFKAPSRHMVGDDFDLPGVPFDSYFWGAVAIHGTYWHNDYGRPRSHGCVNVPSQAAKWIFRWTTPVVPYEEHGLRVQEGGTPVVVF